MDTTVERTRRHLAEAEADVARLRVELSKAETNAADLREQLERDLEYKRREEELARKREREEAETRYSSGRAGKKGMSMHAPPPRAVRPPQESESSEDDERTPVEKLQDQLKELREKVARYDRMGMKGSFWVDERRKALEQIAQKEKELEDVRSHTATIVIPTTSPERVTPSFGRRGDKGLGGGGKKKHTGPPLVDEEQRGRRIKTLEDDLEYARSKFEYATTTKQRGFWVTKISEMTKELEELQRGGPVNSCIECHDPHQNIGRSFCGSQCQRSFLLAKMKI